MPRHIEYDVTTRAHDTGLVDTARNFERVADAADTTNKSLTETSKSMHFAEAEAARLKQRIRETAEEIDKTGNTALFRDLGKDKSALRRVEALGKELASSAASAGVQAGQAAGQSLMSSLGSSMQAAGPYTQAIVTGALVQAAVLAAPAIGGVLAGGITTALATGVLGAGILGAAQYSDVQAAGARLGTTFKEEFARAAEPMVQPVLRAIHTLSEDVDDLHMEEMFSKVAPYVGELTKGVVGLANGIADGLNDALGDSGPMLHDLAQWLPRIGNAVGDAMAKMAASEGSSEAFRGALTMLTQTVVVTGDTVAWLGDRFDWLYERGRDVGDLFTWLDTPISESEGQMSRWVQMANRAGDATTGFGGAASNTAETLAEYAARMEHLNQLILGNINATMAADRANISYEAALDGVTASVEENGTSLDIHGAKGRANATALLTVVDAAKAIWEAADKTGPNLAKANAAYDKTIDKLIQMGVKAGFSKAELQKLVGDYKVNVTTTYRYNYISTFSTYGTPQGKNSARIGGNAVGTRNAPEGWSWVNETGEPELIKLRAGDQIMTAGQSRAAAGGGSGSGLLGTLRVVHETPDGVVIREELLELKRQRGFASLGLG